METAVSSHDEAPMATGWVTVVVPPVCVVEVTTSTVHCRCRVALAEISGGHTMAGAEEGGSSGPADRLGGPADAVLPDIAHLHGSLVFERPTWAPFPKPLAQYPFVGQLSRSPKPDAGGVDLGDTAVARFPVDRQEFWCRSC